MKLLMFKKNDNIALGVKLENGIVDVETALQDHPADAQLPQSVMEVIEGGTSSTKALEAYISTLDHNKAKRYMLNENTIQWEPCVTSPNKIICVGLNYRKHAEETNSPIPEYPILFNKFNNTLTSHKKDVAIPKVTEKLDYECELVIVIGKKAKYIAKEEALNYVFGYCCVNDLSARDLQLRTQQWLLGKTCDDFSPLGPYLVTADEVSNPNNLNIKTIVNGEVRQNSNTSDMIFNCEEIVSYISQHMTLVPGDIILTGTPEGVVMGYPPEKQVYLQPGDEVSIEIEGLGKLTNRMVKENA